MAWGLCGFSCHLINFMVFGGLVGFVGVLFVFCLLFVFVVLAGFMFCWPGSFVVLVVI
jgi:hypothetical protein